MHCQHSLECGKPVNVEKAKMQEFMNLHTSHAADVKTLLDVTSVRNMCEYSQNSSADWSRKNNWQKFQAEDIEADSEAQQIVQNIKFVTKLNQSLNSRCRCSSI